MLIAASSLDDISRLPARCSFGSRENMTAVHKYSVEELGWQRKPGPPRIWRVVEGRKKTAEGKSPRFSIQEIPKDRQEDVIQLMSTAFLRDEPLCASVGLLKDPEALADFHKIWWFAMEQGIVVGAFLVDENNPKPPLAGVNMILVNNAAVKLGMKHAVQLTSESMKRLTRFMANLDEEADVRKIYNVDKYITAFGLCVHPQYRGQGLGYQLLRVRDDVSVAYDIPATSTVFSAPAAQSAAASADFEDLIDRLFADLKNSDGNDLFPGIASKRYKLMGKRFVNDKTTMAAK